MRPYIRFYVFDSLVYSEWSLTAIDYPLIHNLHGRRLQVDHFSRLVFLVFPHEVTLDFTDAFVESAEIGPLWVFDRMILMENQILDVDAIDPYLSDISSQPSTIFPPLPQPLV